MRPTLIALVAALALASAADAVSLTVTPDQASYDVGDTIFLSIVGDVSGSGAGALAIYGRLEFDSAKLTPLGATQSQMTSFGGAVSWTLGSLPAGAGFQTVFNQISGFSPHAPDGNLIATAAFQVDAPGPYDFYWADTLNFFGLTSDGTVLAAHVVPEPATAALLGGGLVALALARRRRR